MLLRNTFGTNWSNKADTASFQTRSIVSVADVSKTVVVAGVVTEITIAAISATVFTISRVPITDTCGITVHTIFGTRDIAVVAVFVIFACPTCSVRGTV